MANPTKRFISGAIALLLMYAVMVTAFLTFPVLREPFGPRVAEREPAAKPHTLAEHPAPAQAPPPRIAPVEHQAVPAHSGGAAASVGRSPSADTDQAPLRTEAADASDLDRLLRQIDHGPVAFDTPASMNLRETRIVQLQLNPSASIDQIEQQIAATGAREGLSIHVSQQMRAHLGGEGFEIRPIDTEQQWVPHDRGAAWRWNITPITGGTHSLRLNLDAIVTVGGVSAVHSVRVFDRVVEVNVSLLQRLGGAMQQHMVWLWTLLILPVLVGVRWWRRRHRAAEGEPRTR